MKKLILGGLAALALIGAPVAQASPSIDCYTQETYKGTRTTCYSGYPDYNRTVTTCDANHCRTSGN